MKIITGLVSGLVIIFFVTFHVNAAGFSFTGNITQILMDNGQGVYSGTEAGDSFSATFFYGDTAAQSINIHEEEDETDWEFEGGEFGATLTKGAITTRFSTVHLNIQDDSPSDAVRASFLNTYYGQDVSVGTMQDTWALVGETGGAYWVDAPIPADSHNQNIANGMILEVAFVYYDLVSYSGLGYQSYPEAGADIALFWIKEADAQGNILFSALGVLSLEPRPGSLNQTQVSQLYVSIFGRASEGEGNAYWCSTQDNMTKAATTMLGSPAAIAYFGASLDTDQAFVEHIYNNTLGKTLAQDPDGIAYWVGRLTAGDTRGSFVAAMAYALANGDFTGDTEAVAAQNRFNNRVTLSNYTAEKISACPDVNDLSAFVELISGVTHDPATLEAAKAAVDAF